MYWRAGRVAWSRIAPLHAPWHVAHAASMERCGHDSHAWLVAGVVAAQAQPAAADVTEGLVSLTEGVDAHVTCTRVRARVMTMGGARRAGMSARAEESVCECVCVSVSVCV
jgi:hypothetical protein